jgi:hypothetical protein
MMVRVLVLTVVLLLVSGLIGMTEACSGVVIQLYRNIGTAPRSPRTPGPAR